MAPRAGASLIFALVLLAPFLSGCLGGSEDASGEPVTKQRATVTQNAGGIEGIVTDEAVQPIVGANVTLAETNETVQAAEDGSFAFSEVDPGSYTVTIEAPGFISSQQNVDVSAGDVAIVDFILTRLASQDAFTQQIEFSAFIECGVGVGMNTSVASPGVTWATCSTINAAIPGGNATNDDFSETLELEAPINTLVWEANWDPSGNTLAENLWLSATIQGFDGITVNNETIFWDTSVGPPFQANIPQERFQNISDWFSQQCEEGNSEYCGHNFWDRGWPIYTETFTATDCTGTAVSGCAPLQLKVNHVFSAFYNAPAPAGFSVYGGGT